MSDIHPGAVSLEAEPTIESQPIAQESAEPEPAQAAPDDAEPEGVVEHQGRRMVDVSVLAAERRRVRDVTERAIREKELAPLQAKAQEVDQLKQALAEARPYIDIVRNRPELLKPQQPTKAEELVSDDEAAAEARDLELYDSKTGQPDLARAKRIIARRRTDAQSAAHQAAQAAVGPITSATAQGSSKQMFAQMAVQGKDLVDPKELAQLWVQLPPELTQHPEVGQLILDAAIGKSARTQGRVPRAERAPLVTEPAGGRTGPQFQLDNMAKSLAKNAGISAKDFEAGAKTYRPGEVNVLGD